MNNLGKATNIMVILSFFGILWLILSTLENKMDEEAKIQREHMIYCKEMVKILANIDKKIAMGTFRNLDMKDVQFP